MRPGMLTALYNVDRIIHVFLRDEDGKRHHKVVRDFKPYFYVSDKNGKYKTVFGDKVRKVIAKVPSEVPSLAKEYKKKGKEAYESDIIYCRRWLIDRGIHLFCDIDTLEPLDGTYDIKPRVFSFDVELDQGETNDIGKARGTLICWTAYDNYFYEKTGIRFITNILANKDGHEYYEDDHLVVYSRNERELVVNFIKMLKKFNPDIITGWNVDFDIRAMINAGYKYNLKVDFRAYDSFDVMQAYGKMFSSRYSRLKDIAKHYGITYRDYDDVLEFDYVFPRYKNGDYGIMIDYNTQDVYFTIEIDNYSTTSLLDAFLARRRVSGVESLSKTYTDGILVDTILLRIAKSENVVLPNMGSAEPIKYKGAKVVEPTPGRYSGIAVLDASRYYPSIIMAFNISPECKITTDDGFTFDKSKEGMFPKACKLLIDFRNKIEAKMMEYEPGSKEYLDLSIIKQATKAVTNSVYGYARWVLSRLYDVDVAKMITHVARDGLLCAVDYISKKYKVITGDTDSVIFVYGKKFSDNVVDELFDLSKEVSGVMTDYLSDKYGKTDFKFNMKFEKYASIGLFTTKKRYMLRVVWEGKPCNYIDIKGMEAKRTDSSIFTFEFLKELSDLLLSEQFSADDIVQYILDSIEKFKQIDDIEYIALHKGISKRSIYDYKSNTDFVRGCKVAQKFLGVQFNKGDKVKYIYTKWVKGIPSCDVISFHSVNQLPELEVDYDKMISRCVLIKPVRDILAMLLPSLSDENKKIAMKLIHMSER